MARKVFTYKDVEEAKKYIGKMGWFDDKLYQVAEGRGDTHDKLDFIGNEHHFFEDGKRAYQFFSPDPEPVEKWVPFTVEDWELFIGKPITKKGCAWFLTIMSFSDNEVDIRSSGTHTFQELVDNWTFLDKSPCGKKILTESTE